MIPEVIHISVDGGAYSDTAMTPLGGDLFAVQVGRICFDVEETAPRLAARQPAVVLDVASDATQCVAERTASVRL